MDGVHETVELFPSYKKVDIDVEEGLPVNPQSLSLNRSFFSDAAKKITTTRWSKLLPSPIQNLKSPPRKQNNAPRPTAWLDGIRGCAALVVFFEHMSLSVHNSHSMVRAYGSPGATSIWQFPIIRLLYDGTPMVPIFYVTSGCALSLKPLSHIHNKEWQNFGTTISSATFRRGFRLFLPSAAVSFIAMLFTQIGIYNHPYPFMKGNAIEIDRPQHLPNIAAQYVDWLDWVATQLLYSEEIFQPLSGTTTSNYGFQLWTISTEFYASIALFITLVSLAHLAVSRRQVLLICLCAYMFYLDRWDIACFMAGISVTELSIQAESLDNQTQDSVSLPTSTRHYDSSSWLPSFQTYVFVLLFIAGLFAASYPGKQASENFIYQPLSALVDSFRFWESIGAILSVPSYLGRISYGVYLTHVVFLNTIGWRVTPWIWGITGDDGWWGRQGGFAIGLTICLLFLIWIADLWTRAVDEPCVRLAKKVERWATLN